MRSEVGGRERCKWKETGSSKVGVSGRRDQDDARGKGREGRLKLGEILRRKTRGVKESRKTSFRFDCVCRCRDGYKSIVDPATGVYWVTLMPAPFLLLAFTSVLVVSATLEYSEDWMVRSWTRMIQRAVVMQQAKSHRHA